MKRRAFLTTAASALLSAPRAVVAQSHGIGSERPAKIPRVGYLGSGQASDRSLPRFSYLFDAFTDGLQSMFITYLPRSRRLESSACSARCSSHMVHRISNGCSRP